MGSHCAQGHSLICAEKATVASDIGMEDGSESVLHRRWRCGGPIRFFVYREGLSSYRRTVVKLAGGLLLSLLSAQM